MLEINVKEARSKLSHLLNKVEQGQDVILTRRGKNVASSQAPIAGRRLPSLKKFRQTLSVPGTGLSSAVQDARDEERY